MKKKYIVPKTREIKLDQLMDHTEPLPNRSPGEDHDAYSKRVGWDDDFYESLPDSSYTNLWDDIGWK